MKKFALYFKNKYVIAITLFSIYILFLDDYDVFSIFRNNAKLSKVNAQIEEKKSQIDSLDYTFSKLHEKDGTERFAREKKYFKKENEDIFVIFYE